MNTNGQIRGVARGAGKEGAALGVAMVMLIVVAVLGLGLLRLGDDNAVEVARETSVAQAFWAADAGLEHVKALGLMNVPLGNETGGLGFEGNGVVTGATSRGSYSVDIVDDPDWDNSVRGAKKYVITSHGVSIGGQSCDLEVKGELLVLGGSFAMASGLETTPSGKRNFYAWGDWIDGPVYVNDQFSIVGPRQNNAGKMPIVSFEKSAASTATNVYYGSNIRDDSTVFWHPTNSFYWPDDPVLGAPPLPLGSMTNMLDNWIAGAYQVNQGGRNIFVRFLTNQVWIGTNSYIAANPASNRVANIALSRAGWTNICIFGTITNLQGVVEGKLVLVATNAISIQSNIVYASATSPDPWGLNTNAIQDALVLAARKEIVIEANPQDNSVGNVYLHAAVFVTEDATSASDDLYGLCARNYDRSMVGSDDKAICIYGTLTQYRRGLTGPPPSGASDEPSPNKGFGLRLKWDSQFVWDELLNLEYAGYRWTEWRQVPTP